MYEAVCKARVGRDRKQETDFCLSVRAITGLAENQKSESTGSGTCYRWNVLKDGAKSVSCPSANCIGSSVRLLDILERLGGNEKRVGCPLPKVAPDRIIQTQSYIRLLVLLKLGNMCPSEPKGRVE